MITTGFNEIDDLIGGLKKGRIYGLATFNCDRIGAEYFALHMLNNSQHPAFFCGFSSADILANFPDKQGCFIQRSDESAEDICERFESLYQHTRFEIAAVDIDMLNARNRENFLYRQYEVSHIIKIFKLLAKRYHVPILLLGRCHDLESETPAEILNAKGYPRALIEASEKIFVISKNARRSNLGSGHIGESFELSLYEHFSRQETVLIHPHSSGNICSGFKISNVTVPLESETQFAYDEARGIKFSKDHRTLLSVPQSITGEYKIPYGVKSIGIRAFCDCRNLIRVDIPDSVTYIGFAAFMDCDNLVNINIPDSLTRIAFWAFHGCRSLVSINIPDSVTRIENDAFDRTVTDITLPARFRRRKLLGISVFCKVNYRKNSSGHTKKKKEKH